MIFAPRDARIDGIDDDFREALNRLTPMFQAMSKARGGRVFHQKAVALRGALVVRTHDLPDHPDFAAGQTRTIVARIANGAADDDAIPDNRGLSLRIEGSAPHDLLLTTGPCFPASTAAGFLRWTLADRAAREQLASALPELSEASWGMFRRIEAFSAATYYTKCPTRWDTARGHAAVRYRLRPVDSEPDAGEIEPDGVLPPEQFSRAPGDDRPTDFLRRGLVEEVRSTGVRFTLEVQLVPVPDDPEELDDLLDPTFPWDDPWHALADLVFDEVLDEGALDDLVYNPWNAPDSLRPFVADSATRTASLNQARCIVYALVAAARRGETAALEAGIARLNGAPPPPRVCVIGAGVSGLTVARELERRGAVVTVVERADHVGGKASSVRIDDRAYDLGAHLCSDGYRAFFALTEELGIALEPVTPVQTLDIGEVEPFEAVDLTNEYFHYHRSVRPRFAGVVDKGPAAYPALAQPIETWLSDNGLVNIGRDVGVSFTAAGYGHLDTPDLPAYYWMVYAEIAAFSGDVENPRYQTPVGGFGAVWCQVADGLRDVRCGAEVSEIVRHPDGVDVTIDGETLAFDTLVMATPSSVAADLLDEPRLTTPVRTLDYATVLCDAENIPRDGFYLVRNHCLDPDKRQRTTSFHHRYADADTYAFYLYPPAGTTDEALVEQIRGDIQALGGTMGEVHLVRRWSYSPHLSTGGIEAGGAQALEALQGQQNTYYVGSSWCFELVETNMRHSQRIANRIVPDTVEDTPVSEPASTTSAPRWSREALHAHLRTVFAEELQVEPDRIGDTTDFPSLGLSSLAGVQILDRVSSDLDIVLAPLVFFEHPTLPALTDHLLAQLAKQTRPEHRPWREQRTSSPGPRDQLDAILCDELRVESIPHDQELSTLGLDSIRSVQVLERLNRTFQIAMPPIALLEHRTVAQLASHIASLMPQSAPVSDESGELRAMVAALTAEVRELRAIVDRLQRTSNTASPWFKVHGGSAPITQRVICLHGAGEAASSYDAFAQAIVSARNDIEVLAVELRGRPEHPGTPFTHVEPLLAALEAELAPRLDVPVTIVGHSMGAMLAFELTKRLEVSGHRPRQLVVASFWSPDTWTAPAADGRGWPSQMGPTLWADNQVLSSWTPQSTVRLQCSIRAFVGDRDPIVQVADLRGWEDQTEGSCTLESVAAAHTDLLDRPVFAERILRGLTGGPVDSALLARLDQSFDRRDRTSGHWNFYDRCWVARIRDDEGGPLFPDVFDALVDKFDPDGSTGDESSPMPSANLAFGMMMASTIVQWRHHHEGRYDGLLEPIIDRVLEAKEQMTAPHFRGMPSMHGRHFRMLGMLGQSLIASSEAQRLLATAGGLVPEPKLEALRSLVSEAPPTDMLFETNSWGLGFGEHFDDATHRSERCRTLVKHYAPHMPTFATAFGARHFDATRDPETLASLEALLEASEDGLRPAGLLQQVCFALMQLNKVGPGLAAACPNLFAYFMSVQRTYGVGLDENSVEVDIDSTALAIQVCATQGLESPIIDGLGILERMWDEDSGAYANTLGTYFNVNIFIAVLRAFLLSPEASYEDQRRVWCRTLDALHERDWVGIDHLSPIYLWEGIVTTLFEAESRFPNDPTDAHHIALGLILDQRQSDGGFASFFYERSNVEETGLALLALKSALDGQLTGELEQRARAAAEDATRFLRLHWETAPQVDYPELWIGKLPFKAPLITDSIVVAALAKPCAALASVERGRTRARSTDTFGDHLVALLERHVDSGALPGVVAQVRIGGHEVVSTAIGVSSLDTSVPLAVDDIHRTHSLTKPFLAATALRVVAEGKLALDAPLASYLPVLEDLRVAGPKGVEPPRRPPTVRDLLLHTAGFAGGPGTTEIERAYQSARLFRPQSDFTRDLDVLARIPLAAHPGDSVIYGFGFDVLGPLLEAVTGESLADAVDSRLCEPLGLRDTGFFCTDASRLTALHGFAPSVGAHDPLAELVQIAAEHLECDRRLQVIDAPESSAYLEPPTSPSAGSGLLSTAPDIMRFIEMLRGGGSAIPAGPPVRRDDPTASGIAARPAHVRSDRGGGGVGSGRPRARTARFRRAHDESQCVGIVLPHGPAPRHEPGGAGFGPSPDRGRAARRGQAAGRRLLAVVAETTPSPVRETVSSSGSSHGVRSSLRFARVPQPSRVR